jgi:hypothetical protein
MSKTSDKIIELFNSIKLTEDDHISNCCGAPLVENSYSFDEEYGSSGKCSKCNEGCGAEIIPELDSAGFDIDGNDNYHPNKYYNHQELKGAKEWAIEYLSRKKR